MQEASGTD